MNAIARIPSPREVSDARLPAVYQQAVKSLATCERIDECKTWADKAAALASYGRQSEDKTLVNHALRIQARATRRVGELLEQFKAHEKAGRPRKNGGAGPTISQRDMAKRHGISKDREVVARRAANIPRDLFESAVESDDPPTQKVLSDMGRKAAPQSPPQPVGFYEATHTMGALRRLHDWTGKHAPAFVAGGVKAHEIKDTRATARAVAAWLIRFEKRLNGRRTP